MTQRPRRNHAPTNAQCAAPSTGWSQPTHLPYKQYTLDVVVVLSTLPGRQLGSGCGKQGDVPWWSCGGLRYPADSIPTAPQPHLIGSAGGRGAGQSAIAEPGATAGTEKSAGPLLPRTSRDAMPNVNRQTSQGKQALSESRDWLPAAARSSAVNA